MKKVKSCSISGIAFTMDADAYETLSAYMDSLRASCGRTPDGDEIVADIEARIAELILSTRSADSVVELPLVENIIRQMGRPEDITSESDKAEPSDGAAEGAEPSQEHAAGRSDAAKEPRIPRRLYRDMDNAKLGGVCAGMAKYFGTDPVWVRMLLMLPLVLTPMCSFSHFLSSTFGNMFGMVILAYIVMWFAVPAARSARQKLEMNGERITAQSIKELTEASASTDVDREAKSMVASVVTLFGRMLLILLKIMAGFIVFGLIIGACAMIICILLMIIRGDSGIINSSHTVLVSALGIGAVLVPVLMLVYVLMSLIASRKPGGRTVLMMFLLWIASIVSLIAAAICEYDINRISDLQRRFPPKHRTAQVETRTEEPLKNAQQAEVVEVIEVSDEGRQNESDAAGSDDSGHTNDTDSTDDTAVSADN